VRRLISSHTPWNVDEVCVKRNPPSSGASAPWWWSRATGSSARIHVRSSRALSSKPWRRPRNLENRAAPRHDVLTMTQTSLILKRAAASHRSGKWNDDDFEVLADGPVVGRTNLRRCQGHDRSMPRPPRSVVRSVPRCRQLVPGTLSGIRTGSLGAGSVGVGVGLGTTTGLGIVSGISMGSEPG
jgi:hypothetical protein